jgi:hypothetical protein
MQERSIRFPVISITSQQHLPPPMETRNQLHATLCIAAYGFLIAERGAIPPSAARNTSRVAVSSLPDGFRPRGSPDPT